MGIPFDKPNRFIKIVNVLLALVLLLGLSSIYLASQMLKQKKSLQELEEHFTLYDDGEGPVGERLVDAIVTEMIKTGAIDIAEVADGAITTIKLADGSVVTAKIADGSITGEKIADGTILALNISDSAIITAKIEDGAVTGLKLADRSVNLDKLSSSMCNTGEVLKKITTTTWGCAVDNLGTGSDGISDVGAGDGLSRSGVDPAPILNVNADGSTIEIVSDSLRLADGAVTTVKLADDSITVAKIVDGTVNSSKLADGAITEVKLADDSVATAKIADGAVTTAKIGNTQITSEKLASSIVTTDKIADGTILFEDIAQNACGNDQIMKWSDGSGSWICANDSTASGVTEDEIEAYIFDADNTGTLGSGTLALDMLNFSGTLDDLYVNDAITISAAGSIANGALSTDVTLLGQSISKDEIVNSGGLAFTWGTTELDPGVMAEGENVSLLANDAGYVNGVLANQGLRLSGTSAGLINTCADGQVLKWNNTSSQWECQLDSTGGSGYWIDNGTTLSPTSGEDIALSDGNWVGIGTGANQPYLEFDDTSDYFEMIGADVMVYENIIPDTTKTGQVGTLAMPFAKVYTDELFLTSSSSMYMNGVKILEGDATTMTFYADADQNMKMQTSGTGNLQLSAAGAGSVQLTSSSTGDITLDSNDILQLSSVGDITMASSALNSSISLNAQGANGQVQLSAGDEIDLTATIIDVNGNADISGYISSATWQGGVITDAFIDNAITVSNYLSLSGGTMAGSVTMGDSLWIGNGTGANQPYLTFDDTNNYFEFMGGSIGIGTQTPVSELDVSGTVTATTFSGSGASLVSLSESAIDDGTVLARTGSTETISGTWTFSTEPVLSGSGRHSKKLQLNAEYSGAVLTKFYGGGTDTSTTGTLTADAETSASNLRTYYQWSSDQASLNYYTVAIRITLPPDFDAWAATNALQIDYKTAATNVDSVVDVYIYNGDDTPASAVASSTGNANTSWSTVTIDDSILDDAVAPEWDAGGETAVIYLRMGSKNSNAVQIGDIKLNYLSKW